MNPHVDGETNGDRHSWHVISVDPEQPVQIGDLEILLNPVAQAVASSKVGRNEPCPCGSGKKFKKCCGA